MRFADETHKFLKWAEKEVYISPEIRQYFEELGYYSRLTPAKFARIARVFEFDADDEFEVEDRRKTLEVIRKSANVCRECLLQIPAYRPQTDGRVGRLENLLKKMLARCGD